MLVTVVRSLVNEVVQLWGDMALRPMDFVELKTVSDAQKEILSKLIDERKVQVSQIQDISVEMQEGEENRMTDTQLGVSGQDRLHTPDEEAEKIKKDDAGKSDQASDLSKRNLVTKGEDPLAPKPLDQGTKPGTIHVPPKK